MTTTKTVTKVPQSFTLNQLGVDDIIHSYTYKYEEDNGTWSWNIYTIPLETGILTPIDDTNKPKNVYTINSPSSVTCNVSPDCCNITEDITGSTDFPILDAEIDCFYACAPERSGVDSGFIYGYPDYFSLKRCSVNGIIPGNKENIYGGDPYTGQDISYYGALTLQKPTSTTYVGYVGEYENNISGQTRQTGPSIQCTQNNNNTLTLSLSSTYYSRLYKFYPVLYYNKPNYETHSGDYKDNTDNVGYNRYYRRIHLVYNLYINWDVYFQNIKSSWINTSTLDKYKNKGITFDTVSNDFIFNDPTTNASSCLLSLFGYNSSGTNESINTWIIYKTEYNINGNTYTNTNLNTSAFNITFDQLIDFFTPTDNNPISGSQIITSNDGIQFTVDDYFDSGYVSDSSYNIYSLYPLPIDGYKYSPLFSMGKEISLEEIIESFSKVEKNNTLIRINVKTTIIVIHRQLNLDENNNIKTVYGMKTFTSYNPISVYRINYNYDENTAWDNDSNSYCIGIDFPIARYNHLDSEPTVVSSSGILGTVDQSLSNKTCAGVIYSTFCSGSATMGCAENSTYHYIKSDEDGNQFICTGSCNGNTLTWTSNSRY